jgi:hypothetical protein
VIVYYWLLAMMAGIPVWEDEAVALNPTGTTAESVAKEHFAVCET